MKRMIYEYDVDENHETLTGYITRCVSEEELDESVKKKMAEREAITTYDAPQSDMADLGEAEEIDESEKIFGE